MPGTSRYYPKLAGTWPVRPVFKPVRNVDVSIPVYIPVRYIPADTTGTSTVLTTLVRTTEVSTKEDQFYHESCLRFPNTSTTSPALNEGHLPGIIAFNEEGQA